MIADSGVGADNGKGGIQVLKNSIQTANDGMAPDDVAVQLVNSDGMRIRNNTISTYPGAGTIGVALDASSDRNLVFKNRWAGDSMSTAYSNAGSDNCAKKNLPDPGSSPFPDSCP